MRIRGDLPNNSFGMVRNKGTRAHQGWDLAAPVGTPVFAIADGTVRDTGDRDHGGYGLSITLEFEREGQTLYAFYAHLSVVLCSVGPVKEGDWIGCTGRSGNARKLPHAQEHLHFEIRTRLEPRTHLQDRLDPGELFGFGLYASPLLREEEAQSRDPLPRLP